jgi:hypothetical protein
MVCVGHADGLMWYCVRIVVVLCSVIVKYSDMMVEYHVLFCVCYVVCLVLCS